jgi:hypothetical protein
MGTKHLSSRDLEQLSAYLDGELSPKEAAHLEQRIWNDPALRDALDKLDRTRLMLHSLPRMRAPRNFTLSPEFARQKPTPRLYPVFGFASALALTLLLAVLAGDWMGLGFPASTTAYMAPPSATIVILTSEALMVAEADTEMPVDTEAPPASRKMANTPTSTSTPDASILAATNMETVASTPTSEPSNLIEVAIPTTTERDTTTDAHGTSATTPVPTVTDTPPSFIILPTETNIPTPTVTDTPTSTASVVVPTETAAPEIAMLADTPVPTMVEVTLIPATTDEPSQETHRQIGEQLVWLTLEIGLVILALLTAVIALVNYRQRLF